MAQSRSRGSRKNSATTRSSAKYACKTAWSGQIGQPRHLATTKRRLLPGCVLAAQGAPEYYSSLAGRQSINGTAIRGVTCSTASHSPFVQPGHTEYRGRSEIVGQARPQQGVVCGPARLPGSRDTYPAGVKVIRPGRHTSPDRGRIESDSASGAARPGPNEECWSI